MKLKELKNELKSLLVDIDDAVALVTINRPETLNVLGNELLLEFERVMSCIEQDDEIKGVILTGAGEKAFAAGADITEFVPLGEREGRELARGWQTLCNSIESLGKPVIAAVNGYALGGGNELAMACDIRIASTRAAFGHPEVGLGIMPLAVGTKRLQRLVGFGRAKELILTARTVRAAEAYEIGLVSRVVEPKELLPAAREMLQMIMEKAPMAIRMSIEAINKAADMEIEAASELERNLAATLFGSEDKKEGMAAFLEKRRPEFKNR